MSYFNIRTVAVFPATPPEVRDPRLAGLLDYWRSKKGQRRMPARRDIDPLEMKPWLGNLVLIEFFGDIMHFRVRVDGTNIAEMGGRGRTGAGVEALTSEEERRVLYRQYSPVLEEKRPAFYETEYTNSDGRYLRESKLLLPLSEDGEIVNMVLAGIYYRDLGTPPCRVLV